jgi:hypothetical protein
MVLLNRFTRRCFTGVLGALLALLWLLNVACAADANCVGKRPGDQFWVVSTRHLPSCGPIQAASPDFHVQYVAQQSWHRADLDQLLANEPDKITVIYVHGNRYEAHDAIERGSLLYHALVDCLPPEQNLRMIVWSWPSDTDGGPIRDVRRKTCRTEIEAYYLAAFLNQMNPATPTNLVSYSLGGRVVIGAMHMAAGGEWAGRLVTPAAPITPRYRVAMIAPAFEDDGLLPGAKFQMALSLTERMYVTINACDPILKRFHWADKWEHPTAVGYSGLLGVGQLRAAGHRIVYRDVSNLVGRTHFEVQHLGSAAVMTDVRHMIFAPPGE